MKNITLFFTLLIFISGCSKSAVIPQEKELSAYDEEVIAYFEEVALGFEFGSASKVTRKWGDKSMKIFVGGKPTNALSLELEKVRNEINGLATDGFKVEIVKDSSLANYYLFFGSGAEYAKIKPSQKTLVETNWGLFSVFWNGNNDLTSGYMYVDLFRPDANAQKHLLREELTQSLGLARDAEKYDDSIFQQRWTLTNNYAAIDRELIRLLYHPKMVSGLNPQQSKDTLRAILLSEQK